MQRIVALIVVGSTLLSIFLFVQTNAYAQTAVSPVDPLSLEIQPDYPTPYSTVTVVPRSTIFDIAGSSITVKANGVSVYNGSGSTPIRIQVGGPGSTNTIVITVVNAGKTYSKTLTIRPEQVALVTEPVSSTHPFYLGKGLIGSEGTVRFIAIPDLRSSSGVALNPNSLEYTWKMNDQILESDSGVGKSVLTAQAPQQYRDVTVSVTVQNADGSLLAQASTPVSAVDPLIRIYQDDPLLGPLYNMALTNAVLSGDEGTYTGVPYYFSSTPALSWQINSTDSSTNNNITVRSTGSGQGNATLSFTATQTSTNQTANSTIQVQFGANSSSGFFGL